MEPFNPRLIPHLFVKTTDQSSLENKTLYLPVEINTVNYLKLPRRRLFEELQKRLMGSGDRFGLFRQTDEDRRDNLKSLRYVMEYLEFTEPQVIIKTTDKVTRLTVTYPNGVFVSATTIDGISATHVPLIRGVLKLNGSSCVLFYTVEHLQWSGLDITPYIEDWVAFNWSLVDNVSHMLSPLGVSVEFETVEVSETVGDPVQF